MSSTPSASALTAVHRCQGNIWSRNPSTKRPSTAAYSLGLAGGAVVDPPAERSRSHQDQAPTWEAFLQQGERVLEGKRIAVAYDSPRVDRKKSRGKSSREMRKLECCANLSQPSAHCPRDARGAPDALVRQLALKLIPDLPGRDVCWQIIQMIKREKYAAHICKTVFVQGIGEFQTGTLKVSVTSSCLVEHSGRIPSFVLTGWLTLKSTCLSLTALMSEIVLCKLALLCGTCSSSSSSSGGATPHQLLSPRDAACVNNYALQANGEIHSPTDISSSKDSAQQITEDTPD